MILVGLHCWRCPKSRAFGSCRMQWQAEQVERLTWSAGRDGCWSASGLEAASCAAGRAPSTGGQVMLTPMPANLSTMYCSCARPSSCMSMCLAGKGFRPNCRSASGCYAPVTVPAAGVSACCVRLSRRLWTPRYHQVKQSNGICCIQRSCSVVLGYSLTLSGRMPLCLSPSRYHSKYGTLRTVQFLARSSRRLSNGMHHISVSDTCHRQQRRQAHMRQQLQLLACCRVTEPCSHAAAVLASQAAHRRMVWPRGCKVLHVKWYGPSTSKAIGCA